MGSRYFFPEWKLVSRGLGVIPIIPFCGQRALQPFIGLFDPRGGGRGGGGGGGGGLYLRFFEANLPGLCFVAAGKYLLFICAVGKAGPECRLIR
jgi:hypothetical protein